MSSSARNSIKHYTIYKKVTLSEGKLMSTIEGFPPIIDHDSRVLILGTMPSTESLRKREYYANPRNQFWKIIYSIFGSVAETSYLAKISFIKEKQIALWDVIKHCDREGSADSKITRVSANDFTSLLMAYPKLKSLCFNGQKAFDTFRKEVKLDASYQVTLRTLPSSSPANASMSIDTKIKRWAIIKTLLQD
jgi:hypoxanthine-DNA glycosylase